MVVKEKKKKKKRGRSLARSLANPKNKIEEEKKQKRN
jgi:hypothetical protein